MNKYIKNIIMSMGCMIAFAGCADGNGNEATIEMTSGIVASQEETAKQLETETEETTMQEIIEATESETTEIETTEAEEEKKIVFPDNQYFDIPTGYANEVVNQGTIVDFVYTAQFEGTDYEKTAKVYIPYGYDANDKDKKYDVLYLMHGGGDTENRYWGAKLNTVLDAMFEKGDCEPCLVVTPNYRLPGSDETKSAKNFYYELENYLIPSFESNYNTYAEDTSYEGLKASRYHRAYGGFSMGACSAWAVFENCLDIIAYHMPVSGDCWSVGGSAQKKAEYLESKVYENGCTAKDFYMYACCGGTGDMAYSNMIPQLDAMKLLEDTFIFCDNFAEGNFYYYPLISSGHSIETVKKAVFNALPKFFLNERDRVVTDKKETYIEKCENMLVKMPEKELYEKIEDQEYPEFKSYTYYSSTAERETPVNVLLPKNYSDEKEYPVLYILHGYWDNEKWMARDVVKLNSMYQNLLDSGEAEEMIIVCPYIYCSKDMPYCTDMDTQNTLNYDNFINDMMTDLMPFIESTFSVAKGKENTAITGFSMGGRESLYIGFTYPNVFGYIGAVCPAPGVVKGTGYPYNLEKDEFVFGDEKPYLLMISASDSDGVVGNNPATYHKMLEDSNIEHIWHLMSGTGHDASSVTPHLYNYMRMIFKAE